MSTSNKPRDIRPKQAVPGLPQQLVLLLPSLQSDLSNENFLLIPPTNTETANKVPVDVANEPQKPYFRSVRGYLADKKEAGNICRTCYRVIFNQDHIKLYDKNNEQTSERLRQMLKTVVPSVDLEIYSDPIMCVKCVRMLFDSFEFQTRCLDTELKFNNWISQRKGVQKDKVNLLILVENSTEGDKVDEKDEEAPKLVPTETEPQSENTEFQSVLMDHDYITSTPPRVKKKFSYKVRLSSGVSKPKKTQFLCEQCGLLVYNYDIHMLVHLNDGFDIPLHKCSKCSHIAKTAALLAQHHRTHLARTHKCKECGKSYKTQKVLRLHIKNIHSEFADCHQCHVCGKVFKYSSSLRSHFPIHNPERQLRYICEICGKRFAHKNKYNRHVVLHKRGLLSCETCGKKMRYEESLRKHREVFHENSKYQCDVCRKCYGKERALIWHKMRIHQGGNDYKCDVCEVYFTSNLKHCIHLAEQHGKCYECDICGTKLKLPYSVRKHKEICHGNGGKHKCTVCRRGFWNKTALMKHEVKKHMVEVEEESNQNHPDKENVVVEDEEGFDLF